MAAAAAVVVIKAVVAAFQFEAFVVMMVVKAAVTAWGVLDESGFMRARSSQEFSPAEIRVSNTILSQTRPHIFL